MAITQIADHKNSVGWDDLEKIVERIWSNSMVMLSIWYARADGRRDLASQDARLLKDIGLSREQVQQEVRKAFWQA